MKIMLVTDVDQFAKAFLKKMKKEGEDVYVLSREKSSEKTPKVKKHKHYNLSGSQEMVDKVFESVMPQVVVFAGPHYMDYQAAESGEYIIWLETILKKSAQYKIEKVVYLSSVQIYGAALQGTEVIHEKDPCAPASERGMLYAQGEYMVRLYQEYHKLQTFILRAGDLYANECREETGDFLARCYKKVNNVGCSNRETDVLEETELWPLHVDDLSEAIKRVIESAKQPVYNIVGHDQTTVMKVCNQLAVLERGEETTIGEHTVQGAVIDNSAAKRDLEWVDFKEISRLISNREIVYIPESTQKKETRSIPFPIGVRRTIENTLVFIVFFFLYHITSLHSLFSTINWLLIYIVLISLFMGLRQSALAVILSSIAYLSLQDMSIFEMTNFYSYAESVLVIVQFVFFGLSVSYTTDMLKENLRDSKRNNHLLKEDYEELRAINDENITIKNEYEKRILDSKTSLPKLYSIVRRLMVLEPQRILMEILHVVSELIHTNTVAVYSVNGNNPYLRLINSLDEASAMDGKTWNISKFPKLQEAIEKGELYIGDVWKNEPAAVVPIIYEKQCIAIIVIKDLSFENQTLYQMNLLRTLALLITESVVNAFEYNKKMRQNHYIPDTDILQKAEFENAVKIAHEKQEKGLSEYCVLEIVSTQDILQTYYLVASFFRMTDYFGTDGNGRLFVLLNNTNASDAKAVCQRLDSHDISSVIHM